tara:strand:+ start:8823 stop:9899 length:1077 start_codon:yes stop_codon:yes gene_type:complete
MGLSVMSTVDRDFWAGKRVLVTGHTGFKGSWLCLWLQSMSAEVFGLSLSPNTQPALFTEARVGDTMTSILGDIRDYETVLQAMITARPEIVIHMAAQPLVRFSYQHPVETYSTNVMGTVHVLEAARQIGTVKAVVNVTTDKCYENKELSRGYREEEPMGGHDPYSSSKGCSELVTSAYRRSFYESAGIALASARAGNVIGGGDWAIDRLIPDILRAFERNEPVIIRNPKAVRPWQHVLEPLSGYLLLAEHLYKYGQEYASSWNFGPNNDDAKPVQWILEQMVEYWGQSPGWQFDDYKHPHEANHLKLDISKANVGLCWFPSIKLKQALEMTAEWKIAFDLGSNMRTFTLDQITAYQTR